MEPAQLARQRRLGAAVSVEPGRVMVLHVQHLLVVHGAAASPGGHRSPALGRPIVLQEKREQSEIYSSRYDTHGEAALGRAVCSNAILHELWKREMCRRERNTRA